MIFQGVRTSIPKETYSFEIFGGAGVGAPVPPVSLLRKPIALRFSSGGAPPVSLSGSAHENISSAHITNAPSTCMPSGQSLKALTVKQTAVMDQK